MVDDMLWRTAGKQWVSSVTPNTFGFFSSVCTWSATSLVDVSGAHEYLA